MYKYVRASTEYAVYYTTADGREEKTQFVDSAHARDELITQLTSRGDVDYVIWHTVDEQDEYGNINVVLDRR